MLSWQPGIIVEYKKNWLKSPNLHMIQSCS